MKHLKKFITESNKSIIDREYIEMCFIDLIESESFRDIQMYKFDTMMEISFNLPTPDVRNFASAWFKDINPFVTYSEKTNKLFLDIEECAKKMEIEYPDYDIEYKLYTTGFNPHVFTIRITL